MKTLITAEQIATEVHRVAGEISRDYEGKPLTVIAVLSGSIVFVADLMREITRPHQIEFVRASSYRGTATSPGDLKIDAAHLPDLRRRHVLIVDDIFDTGRTIQRIIGDLKTFEPLSLRTATLLWKTARREVESVPDYFGFQIPDEFVVGYGLDFDNNYRHFRDICVLEPQDLKAIGEVS